VTGERGYAAPTRAAVRADDAEVRQERGSTVEAKAKRGPSQRKAARWEEILSAAAKVFHEKGYDAASVQDVASESGLLKGSIYYYIKTKEDLLYALIERVHERSLIAVAEDEELAHQSADVRLRTFLHRWMELVDANREWLIIGEREFLGLNGERLQTIIDYREKLSAHLRRIVEAGVAEGTIDPETDPAVAANAIFTMLNQTTTWYRPGQRLTFEELTEWFVGFIVRGLAPASG
jgi:AcrR family transcriptional regulator